MADDTTIDALIDKLAKDGQLAKLRDETMQYLTDSNVLRDVKSQLTRRVRERLESQRDMTALTIDEYLDQARDLIRVLISRQLNDVRVHTGYVYNRHVFADARQAAETAIVEYSLNRNTSLHTQSASQRRSLQDKDSYSADNDDKNNTHDESTNAPLPAVLQHLLEPAASTINTSTITTTSKSKRTSGTQPTAANEEKQSKSDAQRNDDDGFKRDPASAIHETTKPTGSTSSAHAMTAATTVPSDTDGAADESGTRKADPLSGPTQADIALAKVQAMLKAKADAAADAKTDDNNDIPDYDDSDVSSVHTSDLSLSDEDDDTVISSAPRRKLSKPRSTRLRRKRSSQSSKRSTAAKSNKRPASSKSKRAKRSKKLSTVTPEDPWPARQDDTKPDKQENDTIVATAIRMNTNDDEDEPVAEVVAHRGRRRSSRRLQHMQMARDESD
eukprot:TRINITY_DN6385_c0_g1_i1.p1 TRINITY_DN6385_c0_g1~~TRINITY_DN6385_c0_g1_i1.p1  ORF type:complete len:444 (+),score=83.82 TRINITY_DN6385_c0_g1_i1:65-1396(+)